MFAVVVTLNIHPDKTEDFLPLVLRNARASRTKEEGCLQFDVSTDPNRPHEFFLYELYTNAAAFDVHLTTSHFLEFDEATSSMIGTKAIATYSEVHQ